MKTLEDINFEVVGNLKDVKGGTPPGERGECDCSDWCACNIHNENEASTSNATDSAEYV